MDENKSAHTKKVNLTDTAKDVQQKQIVTFYKFIKQITRLSVPDDELSSHNFNTDIVNPTMKALLATILKSNTTAKIILDCLDQDNFIDKDNIDADLPDRDDSLSEDLQFEILISNKLTPLMSDYLKAVLYRTTYINSHHDKCSVNSSVAGVFTNQSYQQMRNFLAKNSYYDYEHLAKTTLKQTSMKLSHTQTIKHLKHSKFWNIFFAVVLPITIMILWSTLFDVINTSLVDMGLAFYNHFFNYTLIDRVVLILLCDIPLIKHVHTINKKLNKVMNK